MCYRIRVDNAVIVTAMLQNTPVRRRKLYEDIVARIEQAIINGELSSGDQIPSERELMASFGVGRTSVREALFALQRMGLIALNNGERARVTQPTPEVLVGELSGTARHLLATPEGVRHFQQARLFLEVALARHAAEHASKDDLVSLEDALEANRKAIDQPEKFVRTDVFFHFVLAKISANPIFTSLHTAIAEWLMEQRATAARAEKASMQRAYNAHKRIYAAIISRDPDAAEAAMRSHLDRVNKFYWQVKSHER
jgi:GntR family transcriptional regulator, sialic acid-inducible nan operon repressor